MAGRERNVLGGELESCGTDPMTGFYRDGFCTTGPEDRGSHTVCVVATAEFLEHQRSVGTALVTPRPEWRFPGLTPGDRGGPRHGGAPPRPPPGRPVAPRAEPRAAGPPGRCGRTRSPRCDPRAGPRG